MMRWEYRGVAYTCTHRTLYINNSDFNFSIISMRKCGSYVTKDKCVGTYDVCVCIAVSDMFVGHLNISETMVIIDTQWWL